MFTSLRKEERPRTRKQPNIEYEAPATTETDSNSNGPTRKRGFSLSKQHSIAFDRMYAPKDLKKESQKPKESLPSEAASSESHMSGSSQGKKLALRSVRSEKMLLTADSDSVYGSRSRISIGGVSKSKSRNTMIEKQEMAYGCVRSKEHKSPTVRIEYGFVRRS